MEVLNDPILNSDKEHSIEPILQDTSEDSLSLDHTSDIVSDVQDQIPISHVPHHSLSELRFTTTERVLSRIVSVTNCRSRIVWSRIVCIPV